MSQLTQAGAVVGREADVPQSLRLYSVRQVAQVLQVTDQAVRRLIFTGKLSATRVGVLIRVREDAIVSLLEASPCTTPDSRRDPRRRGRATDGEEQGGTEPMGPQAQVGAARA